MFSDSAFYVLNILNWEGRNARYEFQRTTSCLVQVFQVLHFYLTLDTFSKMQLLDKWYEKTDEWYVFINPSKCLSVATLLYNEGERTRGESWPLVSSFTSQDPLNVHIYLGWPPWMCIFTSDDPLKVQMTQLSVHIHLRWPPRTSTLTSDDPPECPYSPQMTRLSVHIHLRWPPECPEFSHSKRDPIYYTPGVKYWGLLY